MRSARIDAGWPPAASPEWTIRVTQVDPAQQAGDELDDADEARLVSACLEGRREAFDVIVRRHQRPVYLLCYRFAGTHEDASDLTQETFLRAYRGLRGFKGDAALATWLYRIGVNVCLNRAALKRPATQPFDAADPADVRTERADMALLREERAAAVRSAVARLPPMQRATLILRVYQEMPHAEIAATLGSSVGATKANFFHALANLKKLLKGTA